jgi:hypothetical protein
MTEHLLHPRIESKDWATILFVLAFAIVAITKSVYENRFGDMNLIFQTSMLRCIVMEVI